jgi:hypothetical protein
MILKIAAADMQRKSPMSRFIGRFYKQILGDNGRVDEVCQCSVELDAVNKDRAEAAAKEQFCGMHGVNDWTLHADRLEVTPADFPS